MIPAKGERIAFGLGLFLIAFLLYFPILNTPFLYQDPVTILENPFVKNLLDKQVGKHQFTLFQPRLINNLSFFLNYLTSQENTWSYHLTNIFLHSLAGFLAFLLTSSILKDFFPDWSIREKKLLAFSSATLWIIHPVHTEAVAYLSARATLLVTCFVLLALYLRPPQASPISGKAFLAKIAFVLGFLCKETAIIYPFLFLLWDLFRPKGESDSNFRLFHNHAGNFILLIFILVLAFFILRKFTESLYVTVIFYAVFYPSSGLDALCGGFLLSCKFEL